LKGAFKGHLVQLPCNEQGHLSLDQVAQSPIQPDLQSYQGWSIYHISGQHVPVFHHPQSKEFLPYTQSKSIFFWFKIITPFSVPIFRISPLSVLKDCYKVSLELSLLQAEQSHLSAFAHSRRVPSLGSFLWPPSGSAPTGPCLSSAEGSRAGCRTPGGVTPDRSRGAE